MHQCPEQIAIGLSTAWMQYACIQSLLHGLLQDVEGLDARRAFALRGMHQKIAALHKHELVIHGIVDAETHIRTAKRKQALPGISSGVASCSHKLLTKLLKPLIDNRKEQIIFISKVDIEGRWRIANALGHFAHREAIVALFKEQLTCRCQDSLAQFLFFMLLPTAHSLTDTLTLCTSWRSFLTHNGAPLI